MPDEANGDRVNPGILRSFQSFANFTSLRSRRSSGAESRESPALSSADLLKAQGVPLTREKCKACVLAALIADSASVNLDKLSDENFQALVGLPQFDMFPEFFDPSGSQENLDQSKLSMYGNEILPLLQSIVTHGGLDAIHYTNTSFEFLRKLHGKRSVLARRYLAVMDKGVHHPVSISYNSMQCLTKVPIIVARYAGKAEMGIKMTDAVRAHQSSTEAVQLSLALAKILERVVAGYSIVEALSWSQCQGVVDGSSQRHVQTVLQSMSIPHAVFAAKTGKSDKLPAAFLTCLHAAATSTSYEEAVRLTLKAGGSGMAGRAQLAGAFMAAETGEESIPDDWRARVSNCSDYEDLTKRLVNQRAIISILPP